ncbi:hypothetical protein S40293_05078 [Stachybotrys chartarum IBT 40293]|nr:hypothetical protein S40293_05078 [Stachybotrys chartarum IBT 40293]
MPASLLCTLPHTSTCPSVSCLLEAPVGKTMEQCLPELLAIDLELSKSLFAAKNMTAGAPCPSISSDEYPQLTRSAVPSSRCTSLTSYHSASARIQSLGAIQERPSTVSFIDSQGTAPENGAVDDHDVSDTSSMMECDGPTISRGQTPVPAGVSLMQRGWRLGFKASPSLDNKQRHSWVDSLSDDDDQDDRSNVKRSSHLSPQPLAPDTTNLAKHEAEFHDVCEKRPLWRHKSHSTSAVGTVGMDMQDSRPAHDILKSARQSCVVVPERRSSLGDAKTSVSPLRLHPVQIPATEPDVAPVPRSSSRSRFSTRSVGEIGGISIPTEPSPVSDTYPDTDIRSTRHAVQYQPRPETMFIQPSPPPSPPSGVQTRLCKSSLPYSSQLPNEELSKSVPLPPDTIETLRVSIACFPETMLLTSSLTIETIRAYSRKIRQPGAELAGSHISSPTQSSRKSIWQKVTAYRRGSVSSERKGRDLQQSNESKLQSSSTPSLELSKPWLSLRNVFGNTSEYICDALYAHILAYNYISALVPRSTPVVPGLGRRQSRILSDLQHDDIPRKAASLLGLSTSLDGSPVGPHGQSKGFDGSLVSLLNKDDTGSGSSPAAATYEHAIRDIQSELMRCISRLVTTAKLVAESGCGEDRLIEVEAHNIDVFLMRSLCEIVRIAEEGMGSLWKPEAFC